MSPVRLTRRVRFSAGHRYWDDKLNPEANKALFGPWASPYNHGHNYVLDATTIGQVNPTNGMVVNIKTIDDLMDAHIVGPFDQKSLNDEVSEFAEMPPSVENILEVVKDRLSPVLPVPLIGLKLEETPLLYGELQSTMQNPHTWKLTLTRVYEFAASHRLNVPSLSVEENLRLFGKCNNPSGHGHDYVLEVTVTGTADPQTGMLVDIGTLDKVVNERVIDRYDHHNLNEDLPEFAAGVTTSEIVAQAIWDNLAAVVPAKLDRIRLFETARNIFEINAEDA